jgi:rubrerythrin
MCRSGPDGRLYTTVASGRVLVMQPDGQQRAVFAETGGRVLGFDFDRQDRLVAADAMRGLLRIEPDGQVRVLADAVDGDPIRYADAVVGTRRQSGSTGTPVPDRRLDPLRGARLGWYLRGQCAGHPGAVGHRTRHRTRPGKLSDKGSKTEQCLKDAFAGESQANRRYLYFANKADVEGQNDVAALFRSTAEGETGHAHGHLEFLEAAGDPATGMPIGSTRQNLESAVAGETHEYTDMYPGMAKTARDEGFDEIADWFETLAKAERSHANRYQKALNELVD